MLRLICQGIRSWYQQRICGRVHRRYAARTQTAPIFFVKFLFFLP